jgi:hypothetical protein
MGYQTDVLIANCEEAQSVADSDSPTDDREGFTFNGFDRVQLCTLLSLTNCGNCEAQFDRYLDAIDVVSSSTDEWPVVSVVKPELVAELADVAEREEDEFNRLAESWAATEEFAGWESQDVHDLLRDLTDLADSAKLNGKCLMIWHSP